METCARTILFVDDDESIRQLASLILRREGYRVLEAGNGVEALRVSKDCGERIDLLLSDILMPQMGGWELADAFRLVHPESKVLLTSGYVDELAITGSDAWAFLPKPFSGDTLVRRVREILSGRV